MNVPFLDAWIVSANDVIDGKKSVQEVYKNNAKYKRRFEIWYCQFTSTSRQKQITDYINVNTVEESKPVDPALEGLSELFR